MDILDIINGVTVGQIELAINALETKRVEILRDVINFSTEMNISDASKSLERLDKIDDLIEFIDSLRPVCDK